MTNRFRALDPNKLIAEMRGYPAPDYKVKQVLVAVLVLLGRSAKALRSWEDVKKELSSQLTKELLALDVTDSSKGWDESLRATRGLDLDALLDESPLPVATILKWLMAVRLVRDVALGCRKVEKAVKGRAASAGTKSSPAQPPVQLGEHQGQSAAAAAVAAAGDAFAAASKMMSPGKCAKPSPRKGHLGRLPGARRAKIKIEAAARSIRRDA